jgi:hypothetical protein
MHQDILDYNNKLADSDKAICEILAKTITENLSEAQDRVWHGHPVWFLDGNPVVGYSKLKNCVRLLFWSGVSFDEVNLKPGSGKFKDASMSYTEEDQIVIDDLKRWLEKARNIQWDYKNIVKRKGVLEFLPNNSSQIPNENN